MSNEFVRARCDATGHIAALPAKALELGMITGWSAADGPVPDGPKVAAFPEQYAGATADEEATGGEASPEETDESADTESANAEEE